MPALPVLETSPEAVDRVYRYLLGRAPLPAERAIGIAALTDNNTRHAGQAGRPSAEGLADLLWSVIMSPEFQFVR